MNPGTYYVPEGESRRLTVVGVSTADSNTSTEPLCFIDGSALLLLCTVAEAETDDPLFLKQFGASELLLAGLHPRQLDPGQELRLRRFEGGGYEVEFDLEDVSDAM